MCFLLGIVLAPPTASQVDTTSKPQKPDDEAQKQARRWVTFLELDDRRAEAANALLKMGAKAVPALVQALNNPRPVVVQRVCHILRFSCQAAIAKDRLTALSKSEDKRIARAARYALAGIQPAGITLVADYMSSKVIELDKTGKVVWTLRGVRGPWDAERLPNGNYLICGRKPQRVVEVTPKGKVVWSFAMLKFPFSAQRLPNGNTLIADFRSSVLEVDRAGETVWKYDKGRVKARDAERLVNGNTLIVDGGKKRVIEVGPRGEIVWEHKLGPQLVMDADRLPNGNTLITIFGQDRGQGRGRQGKVIEVTPKGTVVWELKGLSLPCDADRLPNGHTLIAQSGEVAEYDAKGKKIWSARVAQAAEVNRY